MALSFKLNLNFISLAGIRVGLASVILILATIMIMGINIPIVSFYILGAALAITIISEFKKDSLLKNDKLFYIGWVILFIVNAIIVLL